MIIFTRSHKSFEVNYPQMGGHSELLRLADISRVVSDTAYHFRDMLIGETNLFRLSLPSPPLSQENIFFMGWCLGRHL
jgi:hypothetical protein